VFNNVIGSPSTEFTNRVIGALGNFVGDFVCTSGAPSGTQCNIKVVAVNQTITLRGLGTAVTGMVEAEQQNHTNAAGNGDSGGTVEQVASDNTLVFAKGTFTAFDDINAPTPCTGNILDTPTRSCSWRVWYEDVLTGMGSFGASIVTG